MKNARRKIWMQGATASVLSVVVLGGIWLSSGPFITLGVEEAAVEPISIETESSMAGINDMEPRERAMEEHGEPVEERLRADRPPVMRKGAVGADGTSEPQPMDRGTAMMRVEELHVILEDPDLPQWQREALEHEMGRLLAEHFPTAAGEEAPPEFGEPKNGDSHAPSWGEILRSAISEGIPYFFMLVQFVIGTITARRLRKAKEATA